MLKYRIVYAKMEAGSENSNFEKCTVPFPFSDFYILLEFQKQHCSPELIKNSVTIYLEVGVLRFRSGDSAK